MLGVIVILHCENCHWDTLPNCGGHEAISIPFTPAAFLCWEGVWFGKDDPRGGCAAVWSSGLMCLELKENLTVCHLLCTHTGLERVSFTWTVRGPSVTPASQVTSVIVTSTALIIFDETLLHRLPGLYNCILCCLHISCDWSKKKKLATFLHYE